MSSQERDFRGAVQRNLLAEMERTETSLSQLARAIGCPERNITRWRGGHDMPRHVNVVRLARYFGRNAEWFYTDHDQDPDPIAA